MLFLALVVLALWAEPAAAKPLPGELTAACAQGDKKAVANLLDQGADSNSEDSNGKTPLAEAAANGHAAVVKLLLKRGADPHAYDFSALDRAIEKGQDEAASLILDAGSKFTPERYPRWLTTASRLGLSDTAAGLVKKGWDPNKISSLCAAAEHGRTDTAKVLLKAGAKIDEPSCAGGDDFYTPLMKAAEHGHTETLALLAKQGANLNAQSRNQKWSALHVAAAKDRLDVIEALLDRKADAFARDSQERVPLMKAAQFGSEKTMRLMLKRTELLGKGYELNRYALLHFAALSSDDGRMIRYLLVQGGDPNYRWGGEGTPLQRASAHGSTTAMAALIDGGALADSESLALAARGGRLAPIQLLLERGAGPNHSDDAGKTAFFYAHAYGYPKDYGFNNGGYYNAEKDFFAGKRNEEAAELSHAMLKAMLGKGASLHDGEPLISAAVNQDRDTVKLLIQGGLKPDEPVSYGRTALYHTIKHNKLDMLRLLLSLGADPNRSTVRESSEEYPLLVWASLRGDTEAVLLLAENGAKLNENSSEGRAALHYAVSRDNLKVVDALLGKGADPNIKDREGRPALALAVNQDNVKIISALLEKGADPNVKNRDGRAPLALAIHNERWESFRVLAPKADLKTEDGESRTPLLQAVAGRSTSTISALLDARADINAASTGGDLPLMMSIRLGDSDLTRFLLLKGARTDRPAGEHASALEYAVRIGQLEQAKVLLDAGANVNARNREGETPLFSSAKKGNAAMTRLLLRYGADWRLDSQKGETALDVAERERSTVVVEILKAVETSGQGPALAAGTRAPAAPHTVSAPAVSEERLKLIMEEAVKKAAAPSPGTASGTAPAAKTVYDSDIDKPRRRMSERPQDLAVVIGIEKYSDLPPAQFAERDAEAVKNHLIALGFPSRNVALLTGDKAGYKGIEKLVETWLPKNADPESRVFFYFSGHGAPHLKTGQAYLVPWDGDANYLDSTGYPIKRLYDKLGALKAKQVIVALDACFSGAGGRSVLAKGARPLVSKVVTGEASSSKIVSFAAAADDEITATLEDEGHGIFTYYFLKGLSGDARGTDGAVTAAGLHDYLKPKVQDAARRLQNREQTPVLRGSDTARELVRY